MFFKRILNQIFIVLKILACKLQKQQIRNNNETMTLKLTCERGMTEAQLQTAQTATTGPIADAGPQPYKVEANKSK
jgi:hypothetical protein